MADLLCRPKDILASLDILSKLQALQYILSTKLAPLDKLSIK